MKIYFVTNNKNKLQEVIEIIDNKEIIIENINVDLPEIQELDSIKIIQEKLNYAKDLPELKNKMFFVEDIRCVLKN